MFQIETLGKIYYQNHQLLTDVAIGILIVIEYISKLQMKGGIMHDSQPNCMAECIGNSQI